ncbi:MAG: hypothetical protein NZ853_09775 [Leptospiraceae bacterium]|nr:hypothetical protein [Leptospiraceae bacterium]MDW7976984.1 hypothetical protein [Leptospiraceae bacterium]
MELPVLLQDATIFLARLQFQYTFLSSEKLNLDYPQYQEGLTELQARVQLLEICGKNEFSYFHVGEAYFLTSESVQLYQVIFSCKTMQKLYQIKTQTKIDKLQSTLANNLKKILPFLVENPQYQRWLSKFQKQNQIFVLLDSSGSMSSLLPILRSSLNPELHHLYVVYKNQNLKLIKDFSEYIPSESLHTEDLVFSLRQIQRELIPYQSELWIFFDSLQTDRYFRELGFLLKTITTKGIRVKIFQTYKLPLEVWSELENFRNIENVEFVPVVYGRVCGYENGFRSFFVRYGKILSLCEEEYQVEYLKSIYNIKECPRLEMYLYTPSELDLDWVCSAYEKKNKTKLVYASSVVSDLERQIHKASQQLRSNQTYYKVLLKDETKAFWIRLSNRQILNSLLEYKNKNQNFYIGLSFYKRDFVENVPDKILILDSKEVPRLFLRSFLEMEKKKYLSSDDIYFFFVQVLDVRYE